jgi:replicative DNA helicase
LTNTKECDILIYISIYKKGFNILHELSIIKQFLSYPVWDRWKDKLSVADLDKDVQPIFSVLDNYHRSNDQQHSLSVDDLANLLFSHTTKDKAFYEGVLQTLSTMAVQEDTVDTLIRSLLSNKQLKEISLLAYDVTQGRKDGDDLLRLMEQYQQSKQSTTSTNTFEFITDDLEELANDTIKTPGLRWRLDTLNKMLGSLRKGDFGFIFARPETGKTTFLASETTFMAEQLDESDGPIIWFNNEEQGNKVKLRCYQASLGLQLPALFSNLKANGAAFRAKTKGKHLIFDSGIIHKKTVEQICRQYKPSLIIFDQLDKIHGFVSDREDLRMGAIYMWARELAKEFGPVIGVCQADGSGEGAKWLTMANVANAKTAKQAEADWILGIGKVPDAGYENLRYLHASKNKLMGDEDTDPDHRHGKREVLINANVARYEDI